MTIISDRKYYSKLLLLGEYTILHGSSALAIPYHGFHGSLIKSLETDPRIVDFVQHIKEIKALNGLLNNTVLDEIQRSYRFDSNIPLGYGLGSSGALTAAIFDQRLKSNEGMNLLEIRSLLGKIESYFHGQSSGTDPLVSYFNQSIILGENHVELCEIKLSNPSFQCYLLDSNQSRETEPLVISYKNKRSEHSDFEKGTNEIAQLNNQLIQQLYLGMHDDFLVDVKRLSELQLKHLHEFIPKHIQVIWREGLSSNKFFLKLCGAGGGGYFLAFAATGRAERQYVPKIDGLVRI